MRNRPPTNNKSPIHKPYSAYRAPKMPPKPRDPEYKPKAPPKPRSTESFFAWQRQKEAQNKKTQSQTQPPQNPPQYQKPPPPPFHEYKPVAAPADLDTEKKDMWLQCVENAQRDLVTPSSENIDSIIRRFNRARKIAETDYLIQCLTKAEKFRLDLEEVPNEITATESVPVVEPVINVSPEQMRLIKHIRACPPLASQMRDTAIVDAPQTITALTILELSQQYLTPCVVGKLGAINDLRSMAKKKFREYSRLIHPDKCAYPDVSSVFAILENAHRVLKQKLEQLEQQIILKQRQMKK